MAPGSPAEIVKRGRMEPASSPGETFTVSGCVQEAQVRRASLSEIAQFAEVIAAIAVVISLVYVGRELRSNSAAVRAASVEGMAGASADLLSTIASDSALSEIWRTGVQDATHLTEAEAYRFGVLVRQSLLTLQNAYFQNELEVLEPRVWGAYHRIICELWGNNGLRASWPVHRRVLDEGFVTLIEDCPS